MPRTRGSSRQGRPEGGLLGAVGTGDLDVSVVAAPGDAHAPRIAADLAILDEAALDVGLDIDFHGLAAVRTGYEMLVIHGITIPLRTRAPIRNARISLPCEPIPAPSV